MARWMSNAELKVLLRFVGTLLAGGAAFFALAYITSGRRGKASPLLPEPIEQKLTQLVTVLDEHFGREWVDRGMDALQSALRGTAPDNLLQLLLPVGQAISEHRKHKGGGFGLGNPGSRLALLFAKHKETKP